MKPKIAYNSIYLFGECYFSNNLTKFLQDRIDATITNLSVGSGSIETFLNTLKYKQCFDPGIFLLGGSVHDKWGWNDGKTIQGVLNWFNCSLYDSTLVLCLTGPQNKGSDETYDHRATNAYKQNLAKQMDIPCLDLTILPEHMLDHIHFNIEGQNIFQDKILNFVTSYQPKQLNPRIQKIEQFVDRVDVDTCRRFTIVHDHNNNLLNIYNNQKLIKQLVPYRLFNLHKDKIPYIDRTLYNNIINPEPGYIEFSDKIFVHATLTYF